MHEVMGIRLSITKLQQLATFHLSYSKHVGMHSLSASAVT